jgi:protein involved in polysaccharide export with SLBB domain
MTKAPEHLDRVVASSALPTALNRQHLRAASILAFLLGLVLSAPQAFGQTMGATSESSPGATSGTPTANAGGPYQGTVGVPISFNGGGSTDPKGETLIYAWDFGDGTTGRLANQPHTYLAAGTYTLLLTVTNSDGLLSTASTTVLISPAPQTPQTATPESSPISPSPQSGGASAQTGEASAQASGASAQSSPYPDVPSLVGLYQQIPQSAAPLQRFGSDLFSGNRTINMTAGDIPVDSSYVLGSGDTIAINVWGGITRTFTADIDHSGRILLPETGSVMLEGQTLAQAKELIQHILSTQFKMVNVDVTLAKVRTIRVYVVGDVAKPGAYDISSLSTPLNALLAAGGPTARGSLRIVQQFRGSQLVRTVDLYDLLLHGVRSLVDRLQTGDTLMVPLAGPQVTVAGLVRRPAVYELLNEKSLADVIQLAGGFLVTAELNNIKVERIEAHEKRTMVDFNVPAGKSDVGITTLMNGFAVQDKDVVIVNPILPYNQQTVFLVGHVFRPGEYPFHDGMTARDLVPSYMDMLPEASNHVEVIRLVPPDYRPETLEYQLSDVFSSSASIPLQPFDTLRIYGRYELDAPMVSIFGEVLRPGKYPLSEGMTGADLVRMAGGFARSAYTTEADVSSYSIKNGETVQMEHSTFQVAKAVDGDKNSDISLKAGDVVTVRQLGGWQDIGASVELRGEVLHAGTYGIQEGERLSAVLRRAGGFLPSAYPDGVVLERVQVRQLAEQTRAQLISMLTAESVNFKQASSLDQEQATTLQALHEEQARAISALQSQPVSGRLVIHISADISKWENTQADVQVRAGDVLVVPKQPGFVFLAGQVFNSAAITFVPGRTAGWYLKQSGGPTDLANKKLIYIVRANGMVIGRSSAGLWSGDGVLNTKMHPGDSIVVPAKIIGGSLVWKNLVETAQVFSSIALAGAIAASQL